ncbi:MAG: GatB/YqeY domain-containing protein [Pseudomonadales bacterium]|nr:GatB/YqeY domain-containing protein [Pseudomonadales bacterium]NIX08554.1 GatB/YqeY domain-containing protein [Pseudomonadales bacterium]
MSDLPISDLRQAITAATTAAMKARDKQRLAVLRLVNADIKRAEVDERRDSSTDAQVLAVLNRMLKQRQDSLEQFTQAGRHDLADQESFEIGVIGEFMPEQLSEAELSAAIDGAIAEAGAESMRDMGKVMGLLKDRLQGRADMGAVSGRVKALLAG